MASEDARLLIFGKYGRTKVHKTASAIENKSSAVDEMGDRGCKAVTGLATFSARVVIYLMLIRRAGT